jgi:hypothetical protein
MAERGRYLYAITRGVGVDALTGVAGLGGGELAIVEHRGLSAVVSDVGLDEYGEEALRANLERMEWLEQVARGHDAVVQAVAALGPTAPLRLATICLDDDGVRARLDEWHDGLVRALDRVEGRAEWSVKVIVPEAAAAAAAAAPGAAEPAAGGAAYLRRKKAETEARLARQDDAARSGEDVHAALAACAVASRRLQPQDPRLTGHRGTMVLNGAYLVEAADGQAFADRVRELAAERPGVQVEAGGPWPPYSFAVLDQA